MARRSGRDLPDVVPLGGAAQELPLDSPGTRRGRRRDRGRHVRRRVYKGSSLETVVGSIAEQRQIFKGADHAFLWKPKLRIPDIYERPRQPASRSAASSTRACAATTERGAARRDPRARRAPDQGARSGRGEPALLPASDARAAVQHGDRQRLQRADGRTVKLGSWDEYLAMRERHPPAERASTAICCRTISARSPACCSTSAAAATAPPPRDDDAAARAAWEADLARVREESAEAARRASGAREGDRTHTEVQGWLRDLGRALGFDVWIAANDRGRPHARRPARRRLPRRAPGAHRRRAGRRRRSGSSTCCGSSAAAGAVAAAFEVEHTTSIYSGIVRLLDLAARAGRARAGSSSSRPTSAKTRCERSSRGPRSAASPRSISATCRTASSSGTASDGAVRRGPEGDRGRRAPPLRTVRRGPNRSALARSSARTHSARPKGPRFGPSATSTF